MRYAFVAREGEHHVVVDAHTGKTVKRAVTCPDRAREVAIERGYEVIPPPPIRQTTLVMVDRTKGEPRGIWRIG